ncbi:MAG: cysteine hydrolase family protein [Thermoplasmataceae archaeon]
MDHLERLSKYSISSPDDVSFLVINYSGDQFSRIFSRMEFVTAIRYVSEASKKFSIPVIYARKEVSETSPLRNYLNEKLEERTRFLPAMSSYDERFREEFVKYLPSDDKIISVTSEDAFKSDDVRIALKNYGRRAVYICGFRTEVEVHMTALSCLSNGYFPVVVSDATSTFSERSFYSALDSMSQVVEVIDTRDLIKLWGDIDQA